MPANTLAPLTPVTLVVLLIGSFTGIALLLLFVELPPHSLFWTALQNSGHTVIFLLLTLLCATCALLYAAPVSASYWGLIAMTLAVFGIAIEFVQYFSARDASLGDVLRNLAGIGIGILVWKAAEQWRTGSISAAWVLLVIALSVAATVMRLPLIYGVTRLFVPGPPIIADFENLGAIYRVRTTAGSSTAVVTAPVVWAANQSSVLSLTLGSGNYPGVGLLEIPLDWTRYSTLSFEVYNPGQETLKLIMRLHDMQHNNQVDDRYRELVMFPPGLSMHETPIENIRLMRGQKNPARELNTGRMKGLMVFSAQEQPSNTLYFDNFLLQ